MTILVLGASGMLGFALHRTLHDGKRDVVGLVRPGVPATLPVRPTAGLRYCDRFDAAADAGALRQLLEQWRPAVVVNAAAVRPDAPVEQQLQVNAALPALLAVSAADLGFRLVHFSTDAVFDGRRGSYREADAPSPLGTYAMCKFLGERVAPGALVLRTSMVGLGLRAGGGLLDWFLNQTGTVSGRPDAVFSGLPVTTIADLMHQRLLPALSGPQALDGVWHLAADPIDKLTLLRLVRDRFGRHDISLSTERTPPVNRSLDGSALASRLNWNVPAWRDLVDELFTFTCRHGMAPQTRPTPKEKTS